MQSRLGMLAALILERLTSLDNSIIAFFEAESIVLFDDPQRTL